MKTKTAERITGATIAQNGTVSYEGVRNGMAFTATTYSSRQRFDWSSLPDRTPVLDLEGADIPLIWRTLISVDHPSFESKLRACREAGLPTTSAGKLARRACKTCPIGRDHCAEEYHGCQLVRHEEHR